MCGIVGAVAKRNIVSILVNGLLRLEYRGYDSAGLVVVHDGKLDRVRSIGRVAELATKSANTYGELGIAHTRWATHGVPSERNAHPHISRDLIAVVHNGIIENYEELRANLTAQGYAFTSDTDTEVIAHLIHSHYAQASLLVATQRALSQLVGAYAIGVVAADNPHQLIAARKGSPLLLGVGEGEHFIASDMSALLQVTKNVVYLEEGDVVEVNLANYRIFDAQGKAAQRPVNVSQLNNDSVELGEYRHYMQKEIHEQPQALADTLQSVCNSQTMVPGIFGAEATAIFPQIDSILILACGTSHHAGMVARYWLEEIAGIQCTVEIASEYRYRASVANPNTLVVTISQSGETADTLAALNHAKVTGHLFTLAICNVPESAIIRQSKLRFLTRAGPEIGVASTKAFTTQLAALFLLTLVLAKLRGRITPEREQQFLHELRHLPSAIQKVLALEPQIAELSKNFADKQHALFLGRGLHYPIALEGALKLKEISYIHAEGYAAGEMKHGPIALIDSSVPVVVLATPGPGYDKIVGNVEEVRARGGRVIAVCGERDEEIPKLADELLRVPEAPPLLMPLLTAVPLQLLAYHVADQRGTDVDQPRNLAKSVTVE